MANENETVMAVCAEWRECIESADPSVWNDERIAELVKTTKAQQIAYLDRIEKAWKRQEKTYLDQIRDAMNMWGHEKHIAEHAQKPTVGNAAAVREVLVKAIGLCTDAIEGGEYMGEGPDPEFDKIKKLLSAALSAPARNCDVGTAEEGAGK